MRDRAVDLPDRGGRKRSGIEVLEALAPIRTPLPDQHRLELGRWHMVRIVAQARQDCG